MKIKRLLEPIPPTLHHKRPRSPDPEDYNSSDEEEKNGGSGRLGTHFTCSEIYVRELLPARWRDHDALSLRTAINGVCGENKNFHTTQELDFLATLIPKLEMADPSTKYLVWGRLSVVLLKATHPLQASDVLSVWTQCATKMKVVGEEDLVKLYLRAKGGIEKQSKAVQPLPPPRYPRPQFQNFRRFPQQNKKH